MGKNLGAIYTPKGYAQILTTWAIQANSDTVLDLGIGMGVFVYHALERLKELGAKEPEAMNQIYGAEINKRVFTQFSQESKSKGLHFNNLENIDFFKYAYPEVDAIIGNPPYVRRRQMEEDDVIFFRESTVKHNSVIDKGEMSTLTDLYVYFLLSALPKLVSGGRFATIVADTWLNARYGNILKEYLLSEFTIEQIISLDRSVFNDAQVKAVIILATKKKYHNIYCPPIKFSRVKNGLPIENLSSFILQGSMFNKQDIIVKSIDPNTLIINSPWGAIFKSSKLIEDIRNKPIIKPIREIAKVQIGLQTLAKDFFVISGQQKSAGIVEDKYLLPFAYSCSGFNNPTIKKVDDPLAYVFYCSSSKENLKNTKALKYILKGEEKEVPVRGKGISVVGYQNKKRIIEENRPFWYDIKTEIDKKPIAEILLPRFIFNKYFVLWNIAKYVPGGTLVQYIPFKRKPMDIRVSLAILTSTFTEIVFRINAQIYGGGTSNLRIKEIKNAPTIDIFQLSSTQQVDLVNAYNEYLVSGDRKLIDKEVNGILKLNGKQVTEINHLLLDLKSMVISARQSAHP